MAIPCVDNSDCIQLDIDSSGVLVATPIIAADATNGIECRSGSGFYAPGRPPFVSTIPASASDGDEIYYGDFSINGELWHLRYNGASASPYKWEYVGGTPFMVKVDTTETRGSGGSAYAALSTAIEVTLPSNITGDYDIQHGATIGAGSDGSAAYQSVKLGSAAAQNTDAAQNSNTRYASVMIDIRPLGLDASAVLRLVYSNMDGSNPATFQKRWLAVHPIRLAAV